MDEPDPLDNARAFGLHRLADGYPDEVAEAAVAGGAAEGLDPAVFVGRHGLRGDLASYPVGLFGEDHASTESGGSEGGGHASDTAAGDEDVGVSFSHGGSLEAQDRLDGGSR